MAFIYTRSQFLSDINRKIFGKIGMIASQEDFANEVVREVRNDISIRSAKRKMDLTPHLFPQIYQYAAPSDLFDYKIIDIPAQAKDYDKNFTLVPVEQFTNRPNTGEIAIDDYNGSRVLLINSAIPTTQQMIAELDSLTSGGGGWQVVGGATNLAADGDDYIKGAGSLSFDLSAASQTTAGIKNININEFDLTDFLGGNSSVFVWTKLNSVTNVTNFILQLGTDESNYYSKTVTVKHDGNAFEAGWNLLRFDLTSLTETGSVTDTSINFASVFMTKDTAKISETDYKFDWLTILKGERHSVTYYSKYGWQSSAGVYKQLSDNALDLLVADESEYDLFIKKGRYIGLQETNNDLNIITTAGNDYDLALKKYGMNNPDESQLMISTYANQQP
jgi:hypothetical protein